MVKVDKATGVSLSSIRQPLNLMWEPQPESGKPMVRMAHEAPMSPAAPFAAMFQKQSQSGDPRRVPMYLLMPFAKVTSQPENPWFAPHVASTESQPDMAQDIQALVRAVRSGG